MVAAQLAVAPLLIRGEQLSRGEMVLQVDSPQLTLPLADLRSDGPSVWERFKRGPGPTLGYYVAILDLVRLKLGAQPIVGELEDAVAELSRAAGD